MQSLLGQHLGWGGTYSLKCVFVCVIYFLYAVLFLLLCLSSTMTKRMCLSLLLFANFISIVISDIKGGCGLCINDSRIFFLNRVIPNLGLAGNANPTYSEAKVLARQSSSTRMCEFIKRQAYYYGDPGAQTPANPCQF